MPFKDRFDDPLRALAFALLGLVVALLTFEQLVGALPGEKALLRQFRTPYHPGADRDALTFFGTLGTPPIAFVTVLVLAALIAHRCGPRAGGLVLAASGSVVVNGFVKYIIGATNPWHEITGTTSGNFPSGHVVYAAAVYGAAAWMMWSRARDVSLMLWTLAGLMGPMRIFIGAHLLSDVLAGYAFGFAWLIGMHRLVVDRRGAPRTPSRRRSPRRPARPAAASRVPPRSAAGTRDRSPR